MTDGIMFATRELDILYLPPGFASPSLHRARNSLRWFYQCDPLFLSWLEGQMAREADKLTPAELHNVNRIRSFVYHTYGITDDDTSKLLPPGAKLPDELSIDSLSLYDAYCGPNWPGMARLAARLKIAPETRLRKLKE